MIGKKEKIPSRSIKTESNEPMINHQKKDVKKALVTPIKQEKSLPDQKEKEEKSELPLNDNKEIEDKVEQEMKITEEKITHSLEKTEEVKIEQTINEDL